MRRFVIIGSIFPEDINQPGTVTFSSGLMELDPKRRAKVVPMVCENAFIVMVPEREMRIPSVMKKDSVRNLTLDLSRKRNPRMFISHFTIELH